MRTQSSCSLERKTWASRACSLQHREPMAPAWRNTWQEQTATLTGRTTFLRNHADAIASMDMFVVPTVSFRLLYGL